MVEFSRKKSALLLLVFAVLLSVTVLGAGGEELPLKLVQCIEAALSNNRDIMIERMSVKQAEGEVTRAWSTFDPIATADTAFARAEQPAGSQLLGAQVSEQESVTWNTGLQALVMTGGLVRLDFQNERSVSNSNFQDLNPQYSTSLTFSVTQPLLRGGGFGTNMYRVRLARNNRAISRIALEDTVLRTVSEVELAYWNLVLAHENLRVNKLSKQLAEETLRMTQTQVNIGVLPPVATLQAEAASAAREEGVIVAEYAVQTAQRELLRVINAYNEGEPVTVIPMDRPGPVQPMPDSAIVRDEALRNNYQLKQLNYQFRTSALTRKVARNSVWPRVDLVGSIGLIGLAGDAGDPTTQAVETGRVIPDPTGSSLGILETTTVTSPPNEFEGDYYDALDTLFSGDYLRWSIGMQMSYPLGNRSARRDYSRALLEERKTKLQLEKAQDLIRTLIENIISDLETAEKRVDATSKSAELARKNMEAEEKKFKVGISTNRDVLEAQEGYAMALTAQVKALVDYNKSRGRLERARMGYIDLSVSAQISVPSTQISAGGGLGAQQQWPGSSAQGGVTGTSGSGLPSMGGSGSMGLP